ncbi:MAG: 6-phospho-beta-glucosidase [Armatimonadota bacterium]
MSHGVRVCVVGAGSSYTPELIDGILTQPPEALGISEIRLTDINADRLAIMAGFSRRAVRHAGRQIAISSDPDPDGMLAGADFVITQIRVGGMKARHLDESIPLKYGLLGQETTGVGGMFKALRTIPAMIEIGRRVERACPGAFILNYTNPSGIVTEAVRKYTKAKLIGLCAGIPGVQENLKRRFSPRYPDFRSYTVGLNHFGYVYRMLSGQRDITAEVIGLLDEEDRAKRQPGAGMSTYGLLGADPLGYVHYFLHRGAAVARQKASATTRAQEVEKIEVRILEEAARPETVTKPVALSERGGGGYAAITFAVMKAIIHDTGEELTANVPNCGCVTGIDDDAVVEVVCEVNRHGARPLPVGPIPLAFRGLVQALKAYETLTVEAAVHRDRRLATLALMNHPLVGDLDVIEPLLSEMLEAHGLDYS